MRPFRRYVHARLHRRLFVWFGVSIALTASVIGAVVWLGTRGQPPWKRFLRQVDSFIGERYVAVWQEPDERAALTRSLAARMRGATLRDTDGAPLAQAGATCTDRAHEIAIVTDAGVALGTVELCDDARYRGGAGFFLLLLGAGAATLWLATGVIARRLARPIGVMARVARDIGDGRLDSRVPTGARGTGELAVLSCAINDMAEHIARQLAEQRELLAAVSHELRTPLGHMRVILDMLSEGAEVEPEPEFGLTSDSARRPSGTGADPALIDELLREIVEMDALVGELLASSRLSFDAVDARPLDAVTLAAHALERIGADPALLRVHGADASEDGEPTIAIVGDATLLARALANLLANATRHGRGVTALRVIRERADEPTDEPIGASAGETVRFEVDDQGPGFAEEEQTRVFETFYRGERRAGSSSLGLGLSLVRRIAEAHGGRAFARNRSEGGARVGFSVASPAGTDDRTG